MAVILFYAVGEEVERHQPAVPELFPEEEAQVATTTQLLPDQDLPSSLYRIQRNPIRNGFADRIFRFTALLWFL